MQTGSPDEDQIPISERFRYDTVSYIGIVSVIALLIAHLVLGENGRFVGYVAGALLLISSLLLYVYLLSGGKRNIFTILMILFFGSHYTMFLMGGGGLFNLVGTILLTVIFFFPFYDQGRRDGFVTVIVILFIATNFIGYLFGDLRSNYVLNGLVAFLGMMTIFHMARRVILDEARIRVILLLVSVLSVLNLFVTVNTFLGLIPIQSPFFTAVAYELADYQFILNTGTLSTSEIYGEWSMLTSFLLLPFLFYRGSRTIFSKADRVVLYAGYFASLLSGILSFSRAIFLLIIVGTILMIVTLALLNRTHTYSFSAKILTFVLLGALLSPILINYLFIDYALEKLSMNPDFLRNFLQNPITGAGTSREEVFALGLERISSRPWIFGNGWSIAEGNYFSWFGSYETLIFADFHNLYFSLIPIVGFTGLILLLMLFIRVIVMLVKRIWYYRWSDHPVVPFMVGLLFVIIFFLVDEYKINATRNSYFTVVLIWLGLAISVYSNIIEMCDDQEIGDGKTHY